VDRVKVTDGVPSLRTEKYTYSGRKNFKEKKNKKKLKDLVLESASAARISK
jgi:hypothetical protein